MRNRRAKDSVPIFFLTFSVCFLSAFLITKLFPTTFDFQGSLGFSLFLGILFSAISLNSLSGVKHEK